MGAAVFICNEIGRFLCHPGHGEFPGRSLRLIVARNALYTLSLPGARGSCGTLQGIPARAAGTNAREGMSWL